MNKPVKPELNFEKFKHLGIFISNKQKLSKYQSIKESLLSIEYDYRMEDHHRSLKTKITKY